MTSDGRALTPEQGIQGRQHDQALAHDGWGRGGRADRGPGDRSRSGGGIAANHNATDMGAGVVSWDWWDGGQHSVVGTLMRGHARTDRNNIADVHVADASPL